MVYNCYLCKRKASKVDGISLHKFPRRPMYRNKWIEACNLSPADYSESMLICSLHFHPDDINKGNEFKFRTNYLNTNAVPSIGVPIIVCRSNTGNENTLNNAAPSNDIPKKNTIDNKNEEISELAMINTYESINELNDLTVNGNSDSVRTLFEEERAQESDLYIHRLTPKGSDQYDKNITPMFIDVKREPEDYDEQKFNDESSDHENDPLSSIKVERNDHPDSNTASTSAIRNAFEFVKHEVFSEDEDISMDVDYENNDVDIEFDDNSSISISDNLSALKQEPSSDKSTESSEEDDGSDDDDDFSDDEEEDDDDEEEDEDEESDESSDDEDPNDPLLKCLKILVDNPDLVLDDPIIALILLIIIRRRKKKKIKFKKQVKRRPWTLSKNCEQIARVNFQNKFDEIRKTPKKFLANYNMSVNTFDELLEKISHKLKRKNTMMRCAISPAERLAVTLRYLVTGNSSSQLLGEFNIGKTTISQIIKTTTDTIWEELKDDSLPNPTKEEWSRIADKFYEKTDFPNCVGSISCKYVKVYAPKHKESEFDRHRKYFATALLAIVDSDMRFLDFSVGVLGNENDNFLTKSTIGKKIIQNIYKLPEAKCLAKNGPKVPFIFTNKDSLNINLMKPFPKTVDKSKLNFNSRIEKTLNVAETCLKYIANKWLVLKKGIGHHTSVESTIKAICLLHNFIMKTEGIEVTEENWTLDSVPSCGARGSAYANEVRNHFVNYFLTPEGAVPWQYFKSKESNVETQLEIEKVLIKEENFNVMADAEEHDDISQTIESDDDTDMKETDK